jgi:hypothetical protein
MLFFAVTLVQILTSFLHLLLHKLEKAQSPGTGLFLPFKPKVLSGICPVNVSES